MAVNSFPWPTRFYFLMSIHACFMCNLRAYINNDRFPWYQIFMLNFILVMVNHNITSQLKKKEIHGPGVAIALISSCKLIGPGEICSFSNSIHFRLVIFRIVACSVFCVKCQRISLTLILVKIVYAMAWWRQVTSHYLSQCWPRSTSRYGVN